MFPQQSTRAVQALTLLAVLALPGCAGPAHQDADTDTAASASAEPGRPVTEQVTSKVVAGVRVPVYPTDSYQPSPEERRVIERAEYVLANRCMEKLGMSWPPPILSTWEAHSPSERRYGVSDRATASQFGYQLPPPKGLSRSDQERWNARQQARLASVERPVMDARRRCRPRRGRS